MFAIEKFIDLQENDTVEKSILSEAKILAKTFEELASKTSSSCEYILVFQCVSFLEFRVENSNG